MTRDPLGAFDSTVVDDVAWEFDCTPDSLAALARDHQESVRALPGVDDIVYEWRRTLPVDPLVERRSDAYFLRIESAVWAEFTDALALGDDEAAALVAVHARQFGASLGGDERPGAAAENIATEREPMVLTRP